MTYLVAGVEGIRCIKLALGLAAAIRQRNRPHEQGLMMNLRLPAHRAAVGLPLARGAESASASVPQLEIRVALGRAREALVHVAVVGRLLKCK